MRGLREALPRDLLVAEALLKVQRVTIRSVAARSEHLRHQDRLLRQ